MLFGALVVLLVVMFIMMMSSGRLYSDDYIRNKTDAFLEAITTGDSDRAMRLFCHDGYVIDGESKSIEAPIFVSDMIKTSGIKIEDRSYNFQRITDKVWVNSTTINFTWDGMTTPKRVPMTFIFRNGCISQIHTSMHN